MSVSLNDTIEPVWTVIDEDTTLQGSTYLNGTNKVIKGIRRPDDVTAPYLTMSLLTNVENPYIKFQDIILQITAHVEPIGGAADSATLSRIMDRASDLIDDQALTDPSNVNFKGNFVENASIGPLWDRSLDEFYVTVRFRVIVLDRS